ncbi:MAG TPA: class I SAM-dependent methyltransferase [Thermoplasmata archaeon]|nr:class I SAM-dependent methyltransferase [Thermoplasmata archaeon]
MLAEASTAETLRLLVNGEKLPLGFVREDGRVFLVARERSASWPIAILRSGIAELALPEGLARGNVELVTAPEERTAILTKFRSKYGADRFARWYERPARVLTVDLETPPAAPSAEAGYYHWLESEFDNVADDYDRHITGNRINRLLRDRSLAHLQVLFANSPALFEVGCGSGMETLPLLRAGHEITAVDISDRMLAVVREKAQRDGLGERLRTVKLRARELDRLLADLGPGSFDGGYSTYGALNCEPDLSAIPSAVHGLLKPESRFVAGVYNRWCLFELAGYSLSFQNDRAWGRRRNPVPVGASRFCIDVFAHSVPDFARLFAGKFRIERVEGVPVFLPPSDLTGYAEKLSRHFEQLARWDAWAGARWPWNRLGDHFLITFRRH